MSEKEEVNQVLEYAYRFIGTKYIYGANGAGAFDCSSFVSEGLKAFNLLPLYKQYWAQEIYNDLKKVSKYKSEIKKGSVLFFGKSTESITHVAIATSRLYMIECGGGDSTTKTKEEAQRRGAMVRIRPISARRDLVAAISLS